MCGITGVIDYQKKTTDSILKRMNDTMYHRGPDGEGIKIYEANNGLIGLAHRRLSILELTDLGKQPMSFNTLSITFNGEIYNYREIREDLVARGHVFNSNSDTEVILHAFKEWGEECAQKFIGMFALIIYDNEKNKLFVCRDRAGVKPLYYYQTEDLILFASELKAFHEHPSFIKKINQSGLYAYLKYGYLTQGLSIFENVHKVKPGSYLTIDIDKKEMHQVKYWDALDLYKEKITEQSEETALTNLEQILDSAFNYRMVSDVPVGVFLSGGIDSSIVTALLQKNSETKIKTFTIGFNDQQYNEANRAKRIAQHIGTEHYEKYCTEKEAMEMLELLPFHFDEPFADTSAIPTMLVSKMAKEHVTVALSADAGDEQFAGYNSYDQLKKLSLLFKYVPFLFRRLVSLLLPVRTSKQRKVKDILRNGKSLVQCHDMLNSRMSEDELSRLLKHTPTKSMNRRYDKYQGIQHYLNRAMALDYKNYMVDDILKKVDIAGMAFSLEGREPFLDQRILSFAAKLPMYLKYNKADKKYLLKKLLYKYVPREIVEGPKKGFSVPIGQWLKGDLKHLINDYLNDDFIQEQNIFNPKAIQDIINSFYAGRDKGNKIWIIISFQMWYQRWMSPIRKDK